MGGYNYAITDDEQKKRQLQLLQAMERQRKRAQELEDEQTQQDEDPDPFVTQARLADPAYYQDQVKVASTASEQAEQMFFDMLSDGGAQGFSSGSVTSSVYDQLGTLLTNFDKTEPS